MIVGIIDVIAGVVDMVAGILSGNWSAAWDGATSAVSAAMSAIWGIVSSIGSGIISTINNIVSSIRSAASSLSSLSFSGGGGGGDVDVESNAKGGIYRKGAFLTTFAEDGPEAAIPLTRTPRALGLWREAGRILGVGNTDGDAPTLQRTPGMRDTVKEIHEAPQVVQEGNSIHVAYRNDGLQRAATKRAEPAQVYYQRTEHEQEQDTRAAERRDVAITMPAINMTLNFYGEQEPKEIKAAVVEAGRKMQQSFAERMEAWKRERGRLAYE